MSEVEVRLLLLRLLFDVKTAEYSDDYNVKIEDIIKKYTNEIMEANNG